MRKARKDVCEKEEEDRSTGIDKLDVDSESWTLPYPIQSKSARAFVADRANLIVKPTINNNNICCPQFD